MLLKERTDEIDKIIAEIQRVLDASKELAQ